MSFNSNAIKKESEDSDDVLFIKQEVDLNQVQSMKQALLMYLKVSFLNYGKYSSIKNKQNPINHDEFISSVPLAIQYKTSSALHQHCYNENYKNWNEYFLSAAKH